MASSKYDAEQQVRLWGQPDLYPIWYILSDEEVAQQNIGQNVVENPLRYGSQQYRGYELLTSNVIRGGTTVGSEVDVMKNGSREARVEASNVTLALAKAKRVIDAMHGD